MMEILFIGAYLFIGACVALYMWVDIGCGMGREDYSLYVFIFLMWPVVFLASIILWIIDFINRHTGGPSMFA